jgi:hypothetical protein
LQRWKFEIDKNQPHYDFIETLIKTGRKMGQPEKGKGRTQIPSVMKKIRADSLGEQTIRDRFNYSYRPVIMEHFVFQYPFKKEKIKMYLETKRKHYSENYVQLALFKMLHDVLFEKQNLSNKEIKENYITGIPAKNQILALNEVMNNQEKNIWFNGLVTSGPKAGISRHKIVRTILSSIRIKKEKGENEQTKKEKIEMNVKYNVIYKKRKRQEIIHLTKKQIEEKDEEGKPIWGYNPNLSTGKVKTEKDIRELHKTKLAEFLSRRKKPEKKTEKKTKKKKG